MRTTWYVIGLWAVLILVGGCGSRKGAGAAPVYYAGNGYGPSPGYGYYPGAPGSQPPGTAPSVPSPYPYAPPPSASPPPPRFARVSLTGMLIGPGKADRTQWDGPGGTVSDRDWLLIGRALTSSNAYGAVLSVMAEPAIQALEKPDVGGTAMLRTAQGDETPLELAKVQDSFTPQWDSVSWDNVPLDGSARIRVVAIDRDLFEDDPMGIFEISASDISAAIQAGRVYPVAVHTQTNKQILFVLISAMTQ